ncbi:universal stress protein [Nocardia ignorata]|uniref:Nucleotide-binding universal stress UspA family protein n=2 Tax=Nocardia ignorata TaxID=145285 RepID=A0A4R6P719_NOCIG|nr:universal stress protein [Nocardia ignorata]TDP31809.1 nucleotide-binding universal stress UspA family protein [Nocardia ignorata]
MSTPHNARTPVVVGVDGSEQAGVALRWAVEYATRHRAPLQLVNAVDTPVDYDFGLIAPIFDYEALHHHSAAVIAAASARAAEFSAPTREVTITTASFDGSAVAALLHHGRSARLLVVGSRGLGALRRTVLGSVSTALARHADCPVAVIPETEFDVDAPIVVGVDGSACSTDAIALAFDEAAHRGVRLVAVHARSRSYRHRAHTAVQIAAEALLSDSLADHAEKYPEVKVDLIAVEDRPSRALLTAGADAQLIVVGSHGRGGFAGMPLGSVAQAVLHGTDRPLIIARPRGEN